MRDRRGDPGGIGRHIQEAAPLGDQVRIDGRGHDPAAVGRAIGRHQERVVEHERVRGRLAVQRRAPEGARVDGVHGLAQVEVEVLRRPTAMAVQGDRRHRPAMSGMPMHAPEPVSGRHDGILSGEGDGGPGLRAGEADVRQQVVERVERVEPARSRRGVGVAAVSGRRRHAVIVASSGTARPRAMTDSVGTEKCCEQRRHGAGPQVRADGRAGCPVGQ